ncbi:MAG: Alkaline phosphatase precursor, partial [Rhizorhabdus sp.]|nr:Alkaline phosphatase precursor [Rhizorhabdus sp.]
MILRPNRRELLAGGAATLLLPAAAPAIVASDRLRPVMAMGVMSGDVLPDRAMIWGSADRPARMIVEWSLDPAFRRVRRAEGGLATLGTGLTAHLDLGGLPAGRDIFYRVAFHDPHDAKRISDWAQGRLRTPGFERRRTRFTFAGDEAGQGFGINPDLGGYRIYEAMRRKRPDIFIHQGDQIYADGILKPEVPLHGGGIWHNLTTPVKDHVAQTLDDFRGAYAYNLLDTNKRRFLAEVPMLIQWDDHEVRNNWYRDKHLATQPDMPELIVNARRAMFDYNPIRAIPGTAGIYRSFRQGPLLEIFILDARSRRGSNAPEGMQPGHPVPMFGAEQIAWLQQALLRSTATWKLLASDIPLSLTVPDLNKDVAKGSIEGLADGQDGPPGGREIELAGLLSFIRRNRIRNTVWTSADVHYAAAIRYEP